MPSLLQKLSYFDPETGNTFVVASDRFYWKEGKKNPEDSKITQLVVKYGWKLQHGTDAFLVFQNKQDRNALFVVRGNKRWFYELRDKKGELYAVGMKGKGLDTLHDALKSGAFTESMEKAASPAATAVNNAGNGHNEVDSGFSLLERRILGYDATDKGACLILSGGVKTASGATKHVPMYVTAVKYESGYAMKLANFQYSPDSKKAKMFMPRTAANLAKQIRRLCGQTPKIAKPGGGLLTTKNIKTQKQPPNRLLTQQNLKTQKGESKGYLTGVMHMMPSDLAGYGNVCPCASPECRQMCLNTAGVWANAPVVQNSRRMKTELYFKNRPQFMADMRKSIAALVRKAEKNDLTPAVRINGTSDLPQVAMEMAKEFPEVQFYDYTKIPQPWKRQLPNYHITFSRSEINDKETMEALEHGVNVAVVFAVAKGEPMPKEWRGYPVINGDEHDLRFLDKLEGEGPFVIGLSGKGKAKGKNKGTDSGFVVDPKSLVQIAPSIKPEIAPVKKKDDLVQIGQPPASPTEQQRTRPATEPEEGDPFWEEKEETVTASAERRPPHNEWFVEAGFDDMHLHV